jgi:hypothetical protein
MKKYNRALYLYHKVRKMAAVLLNSQRCGKWYVEFTDGSKMQVVPGRYAKIISEEDYKWIAGAASKKWKRNKSNWDMYQIQRAQKIVASL